MTPEQLRTITHRIEVAVHASTEQLEGEVLRAFKAQAARIAELEAERAEMFTAGEVQQTIDRLLARREAKLAKAEADTRRLDCVERYLVSICASGDDNGPRQWIVDLYDRDDAFCAKTLREAIDQLAAAMNGKDEPK